MAKQPPPAPPQEALPDNEANRYVAKVKTSLCKRWSITKSETLYEIADLAAYLWALERPREAFAVAAAVATTVLAPPPLPRNRVNYNLWCPATFAHALVAHLSDRFLPAQAKVSRAALLADPGIARDNPDYLDECVNEARQLAAAAPDPKEMKWECRGLARGVNRMLLYSELAAAGDALFAPHAADASALFPQLLAKLGAKLRTAK